MAFHPGETIGTDSMQNTHGYPAELSSEKRRSRY
jgi:hypothetical protein